MFNRLTSVRQSTLALHLCDSLWRPLRDEFLEYVKLLGRSLGTAALHGEAKLGGLRGDASFECAIGKIHCEPSKRCPIPR